MDWSLSQIVVPMGRTQELWEKYHNTSGHMGVAKIEALLRKAFYWPGMTTNLQECASTCASGVQQKRGPLVPILTSYPLETVSINDLSLGRHGDTYPYLLVMTDLFSKYGWAVSTKDQTAKVLGGSTWSRRVLGELHPDFDIYLTFKTSNYRFVCQKCTAAS